MCVVVCVCVPRPIPVPTPPSRRQWLNNYGARLLLGLRDRSHVRWTLLLTTNDKVAGTRRPGLLLGYYVEVACPILALVAGRALA